MKTKDAEKLVDKFLEGRVRYFTNGVDNYIDCEQAIKIGSLHAIIIMALSDTFRCNMSLEENLRDFIKRDFAS